MRRTLSLIIASLLTACCGSAPKGGPLPDAGTSPDAGNGTGHATLPLALVTDVGLPGNPSRFDYQDLDPDRGHLVIAHMNDSEVLVVNLGDYSLAGRIPNIDTVRGVVVANPVNRIFASAMNGQVVLIDATTLQEVGRAATGTAPDGVGWDPVDSVVASSDQGAGALSLIGSAGTGTRIPVPLGSETGNIIYDASRGLFWVTVVQTTPPDQLVGVDPKTGAVQQSINLPGCDGAHGLRLHPDNKSALIACEGNNTLARVDIASGTVVTAPTGVGPDVLAIDPGLNWLYVAAESGHVFIFDIGQPGLHDIGHENPGATAHTVAVDPATHRVFFPLVSGTNGAPVLRVMKPQGL
jgi:DNA-binding beta-propeller fold protein YncE